MDQGLVWPWEEVTVLWAWWRVPAPSGRMVLGTGSILSLALSSCASVILQGKQARPTEVPRLQLSSGFVWDVGLDSLTPALPPRGESSDSEEDDKPQPSTVFCRALSFSQGYPGICLLCSVLTCRRLFWPGRVVSGQEYL